MGVAIGLIFIVALVLKALAGGATTYKVTRDGQECFKNAMKAVDAKYRKEATEDDSYYLGRGIVMPDHTRWSDGSKKVDVITGEKFEKGTKW